MKLYSYFQSSASYRVRIALNLKQLAPETAYVDLLKGEQRGTEYLSVNPQGLVPTLIQNGNSLTQSLAILEYLEETYPTPALLPEDPFARAYVRSLALLIACETAPIGNLKIRRYLESEMKQDKETVEQWMRHWIAEGFSGFEKNLAQESYAGKYCCGDQPGLADCCLMPQLYNARRWKVDMSSYPHISAIEERCAALPAFIQAHPSNQSDAC